MYIFLKLSLQPGNESFPERQADLPGSLPRGLVMQVPFLQTLDARALRFLIGRLSDPWLSGVNEYFRPSKGFGAGRVLE